MNTRRSFIKTSTGVALAFGSGTRLASASISGNATCEPVSGQINCSLQGPSGTQNYVCDAFEKGESGLPCTATCEMSRWGVFNITSC
jgi:hypothetical protein